MAIPYPIDPSLPSNPTPLFSDATAVRGDHMRANNEQIWANFVYIVNTILGGAVLSTDGTMAANSDLKFPSEKALKTYIATQFNALLPVGFETYWPGVTPPANWIVRDGSSLSRSSYSSLFSAIAPVTSGLTMTLASPCVLTLNNHGLQTYQCISIETTGELYTGLAVDTNYYVHVIDVNTFHVCSSIANVTAGSYLNTSGSQSGVHSLRYSSYGLGAPGYFKIPDDRGIHIVGTGTQGNATGWVGSLSWHKGVQGYYEEDAMQRMTGSMLERGANIIYASGVFAIGQNGQQYTGSTNNTNNILNFDSVTSEWPNPAKTSDTITRPARVGHLPIIKYQ